MKDFKNKVVVITGAASGMGRAYAKRFAHEGAKLALCDYDQAGLQETLSLLDDTSVEPYIEAFDISDQEKVEGFADSVQQQLGTADLLINNAGIEGSAEPVWATKDEYFRRVMEVNYFGVVYGTCAFLKQMRAANRGVIVNVSSIFGLTGSPNHADYCGSKFAVRGFTESLMIELHDSPIKVHLLHPGGIQTNIARQGHSQAFAKHFFQTTPEQIADYLVDSIRKERSRMVFGHGAWKTYLGTKLLPFDWLKRLVWAELKPVIDRRQYP